MTMMERSSSIEQQPAYSTGLISLSIHDELNSNSSFNGVQLAIRPNLFPDIDNNSNSINNHNNTKTIHTTGNSKTDDSDTNTSNKQDEDNRDRPYLFLVEIRVWDKRLGVNTNTQDGGGGSISVSDNGSKLYDHSHTPTGYDLRTLFTMAVTRESLTGIKTSSRTQISLLKNVADLYEL